MEQTPELALIIPMLEQLQSSVLTIKEEVLSSVPRKPLTQTVKQRYQILIAHMVGRCPCCGVSEILNEFGVLEAELDHFYSRERAWFEDTWLICKPCHLQ